MKVKLLYFIITTIGIISAFLILTSLNPISRLVLLILVFVKSAFIYQLLDFYFLGLSYIIVYVGAIAILFLFVIMKSETKQTPKSLNSIEPKLIKKNDLLLDNSQLFNSNNHFILRLNNLSTTLSPLNSSECGGDQECLKNDTNFKDMRGNLNGKQKIAGLKILIVSSSIKIGNIEEITNILNKNFTNNETFLLNQGEIYNFFIINYSMDFTSFTDLQSFGFILYLSYPFITILFALLLFIVLIGILRISSN